MNRSGLETRLPEPLAAKLRSGEWLRTGHRGAPSHAPGNTRRSIEAALVIGVDLVEVDVHLTGDGRLALWHDDAVPSAGRELPIASSGFTELRRAVAQSMHEELIDLESAIAIAAGRAGLLIDLKAAGVADGVAHAVTAAEFYPAVVCGGDPDEMSRIARLAPSVGASMTLAQEYRLDETEPTPEMIDTCAVTISHLITTPELIERLHRRGIAVLAWTVDDPNRMRALLEMGVDGITSNRPELFAQIGTERATT